MKLLLSSAILAQILSTSTTNGADEGRKRFLFNKQRRADRVRRLGKQLLTSYVPSNKNPAEILSLKPLRNTHLRSSTTRNENNDGVEADVGLLAYRQSAPGPAAGDAVFETEQDSGINRRLQSACDIYAYYGYECDCSQVDEATYMGTASCELRAELCYCRDMDLENQFCFTYTSRWTMEGNLSYGGMMAKAYENCVYITETYLEEIPEPLCWSYSYDEYGVYAEECTMMLGDTACNSCNTVPFEFQCNCSGYGYTNYTTYCFSFDCENLGSNATGVPVGSTCEDELPLLTGLVYLQNEWDNVTDSCPTEEDSSFQEEDSKPDDTGDGTKKPKSSKRRKW